LRVKAKMAPPFLIASARSESEERAEFMASKAAEEGKLAVCCVSQVVDGRVERSSKAYGLR
jgi:hypothetical protein